jgi:hypothetical protein
VPAGMYELHALAPPGRATEIGAGGSGLPAGWYRGSVTRRFSCHSGEGRHWRVLSGAGERKSRNLVGWLGRQGSVSLAEGPLMHMAMQLHELTSGCISSRRCNQKVTSFGEWAERPRLKPPVGARRDARLNTSGLVILQPGDLVSTSQHTPTRPGGSKPPARRPSAARSPEREAHGVEPQQRHLPHYLEKVGGQVAAAGPEAVDRPLAVVEAKPAGRARGAGSEWGRGGETWHSAAKHNTKGAGRGAKGRCPWRRRACKILGVGVRLHRARLLPSVT